MILVLVLVIIKDNWITGTARSAAGSGQTVGLLLWLEVQGLGIVGFPVIIAVIPIAIITIMNFHMNVTLKVFILAKK